LIQPPPGAVVTRIQWPGSGFCVGAGFADHVALAAALLPEMPSAYARTGDGAVVATEDGPALGLVQGEMIYVLGPRGLSLVPRSRATRAFRVG